jgi:hypothetical protein
MKFTVWASILFCAALAVVAVTAPGCGGSSGPTLSDLNISPISPTIDFPGGSQQFTATAVYSNNTNADATASSTWSSSNTGFATITTGGSTPGLATAVAAGSTTITASLTVGSSSISSSTDLTVVSGGSATRPTHGTALISFQLAPGDSVSKLKLDGQVYEINNLPSKLPAGRHYFSSLDGRDLFVMTLYGERAYTFNLSGNGRVQLTEARDAN